MVRLYARQRQKSSADLLAMLIQYLSCTLQHCEQGLGLLQTGGIEPLGEATVERCQQLVCYGALTLALPQPT